MNQIGYVAQRPFGPERKEEWQKYVAWSGLHHLSRVVSMDGILCPRVIDKIIDEDWKHIFNESWMTEYFHDLDYLLQRVSKLPPYEIIGFVKEPDSPFPHGFTDPRFEFAGYDLVDWGCNISALVNCGGFPESFANSELNQFGLLPNYQRAKEVQEALLKNNPNEEHAKCTIWPLWLMHQP